MQTKMFLWFKEQFENHLFREFLIVYSERARGGNFFSFFTEVFLSTQNKNFKYYPSQVEIWKRQGQAPCLQAQGVEHMQPLSSPGGK